MVQRLVLQILSRAVDCVHTSRAFDCVFTIDVTDARAYTRIGEHALSHARPTES